MQGTYSVLQFNWDITGPGLTTSTTLAKQDILLIHHFYKHMNTI